MVRQRHGTGIRVLTAILGALLLAGAMAGCGSGVGEGNADGRGGEQDADATTDEETTTPEGDGTTAEPAQKPVGLDFEVVSPVGQANRPEGFGGGTLWATDFEPINPACDDVGEPGEGPCSAWSASGSASAPASASPAGEGSSTLLKRVETLAPARW